MNDGLDAPSILSEREMEVKHLLLLRHSIVRSFFRSYVVPLNCVEYTLAFIFLFEKIFRKRVNTSADAPTTGDDDINSHHQESKVNTHHKAKQAALYSISPSLYWRLRIINITDNTNKTRKQRISKETACRKKTKPVAAIHGLPPCTMGGSPQPSSRPCPLDSAHRSAQVEWDSMSKRPTVSCSSLDTRRKPTPSSPGET
jgi:hypothetical protein